MPDVNTSEIGTLAKTSASAPFFDACTENAASQAPRLLVLSGAGLSADSGLATFRTPGGLWERFDVNRVANALTWKEHRSEVFAFFEAVRSAISEAQPNEAHRRLAAWQQKWGPHRVRLLTQNVDDLLERAGALEVTHLHGRHNTLLCTACAHEWETELKDYTSTTRCPRCNSLKGVKPGVVFFNERAPRYQVLNSLVKRLRPQDLLLAVGTAFEVLGPERFVPLRRKADARTALVDPSPSASEWFGQVLAQPAKSGLAALEAWVESGLQT